MPCMKDFYKERKRPLTGQQLGTKSGRRLANNSLINRKSTSRQPVVNRSSTDRRVPRFALHISCFCCWCYRRDSKTVVFGEE